MSTESVIRILAGSIMLSSIVLSQLVTPWALLLGVFVAVNLIQSAFTHFCPAEKVLARLGLGGGGACSVDSKPR